MVLNIWDVVVDEKKNGKGFIVIIEISVNFYIIFIYYRLN